MLAFKPDVLALYPRGTPGIELGLIGEYFSVFGAYLDPKSMQQNGLLGFLLEALGHYCEYFWSPGNLSCSHIKPQEPPNIAQEPPLCQSLEGSLSKPMGGL